MTLRIILFLATVVSTYVVGGVWYCLGVMSILLCHEMGHYVACRYYRVSATLPVFIPMPLSLFGTMGAIIRIKSPIPHRRALFDVGAAGPLAGLTLAIPFIALGLKFSKVIPVESIEGIYLGEPLVFKLLSRLIIGKLAEGYDVVLHPLAYAGWVGVFVTALNLMPVGQLDGGHIAYALFGRRSRYVYTGVVGVFISLWYTGWLHYLYLIFLTIVMFIAFRHGPTIWEYVRLDAKRKALAVFMLLMFILCFSPVPIRI